MVIPGNHVLGSEVHERADGRSIVAPNELGICF